MSECRQCKFYAQSPDFPERGQCRVAPPAVGLQLYCGLGYEGEWPVVHVTAWCGEFKRRRKVVSEGQKT